MSAQAHLLPDGRLHLNHGPMDLIAEAWGEPAAIQAAHARAWARFAPLLDELVAELSSLRSPEDLPTQGPVAQAMSAAVRPFRPGFITPMAAVAGAVADEILRHLTGPGIDKAYVNNGGDIALYLTPGESLTAAIAARAGLPDRLTICHKDPVRGIATSGWRGRSFSLGIADAATILAPTAAMADAAATIIANSVDLPGHLAITRRPANEIKADSDLGNLSITGDVGPLSPKDRASALDAGMATAGAAHAKGLIHAAALFLQGESRFLSPRSPSLSIPDGVGARTHPSRRVVAEGGELPSAQESVLA